MNRVARAVAVAKKKDMKCGEVKKSTRPGKKIMKRVCENGREKTIHAGDSSSPSNYSDEARKAFRARHNCENADPNTPRGLACNELWEKGKRVYRK